MHRLDVAGVAALREALAAQPLSDAKVAFAWSLSAGPTLARSTRTSFSGGVLSVSTKSAPWAQEINRARSVILARLAGFLGPGIVRDLRVITEESSRA